MAAAALVCLDPVEQGEFVLCKLLKHLRLLVAVAELLRHIQGHCRDSLISRMLIKCLKQIELGIFLNLDTQLIELIDGCVAGKEVLRTRTEADEL